MPTDLRATRLTYAGLFLVTLATLMYEILLTRIFSVTMWYHFAFMAISVAMFGMTAGALLVYLRPQIFSVPRTKQHMAVSALLFAPIILLSLLTHLSIPFVEDRSVVGIYAMALNYVVVSLPFFFSGICVCLALTRFGRSVSTLYAVDLLGAATGCVLFVYLLKVTDGLTAAIGIATLAAAAAVLFAWETERKAVRRLAVVITLLLAACTAGHTALAKRQTPWLRLVWVKGKLAPKPGYETWNSFSRLTVTGNPNQPKSPFGWGLSASVPHNMKVRELWLEIDAFAGTPLTAFDGNLDSLEHLKYDVTNVVHYIRHNADVLAIGVGGGRDILSALAFKQKSVTGVEINEDILRTVNKTFGRFTGRLDQHPKVTFVNDEARSYLARRSKPVDIIQISLIDTFAATAAGAFVLSENALYTKEAWHMFLDRLTPDGVFTCSRWFVPGLPGEMYRIVCLASVVLAEAGVETPRAHLVVLRQPFHVGISGDQRMPIGVGTLLVGKKPFSDQDLDVLESVAARMKFDIVLSPRTATDPNFETLATGSNLDAFLARFPINVAPPTDDSPFIFNMTRMRDIVNPEAWKKGTMNASSPIFILAALLGIVLTLTLLGIVVPLVLTTDKATLRGSGPLVLFFASIGLGFMFIEISQMQRLIIFLGHPTYGLCVVLFVLLLAGGIGSALTRGIEADRLRSSGSVRLIVLLAVLVLFGLATPYAVRMFEGAGTPLRILIAGVILFPLGITMGMAFPLGMLLAGTRSAPLTPWLWGINGATSVTASVLSMVVSIGAGISAAFWTGVACYGLAWLAYTRAARSHA